MTLEEIAKVAYEVNRAYCESIDNPSGSPWNYADKWQKESAISGVKYRLENPNATPEDQHEKWCESKLKDGWKYGILKDEESKEHPCLIPYNLLSSKQKSKDHIYVAVVDTLLQMR